MERMKRGWGRTPKHIRMPFIFVIGWIVVLAGIIMLAIPGPGWATIFLGFAILATEFASAAKVRDWLVRTLKAIIAWAQRLWDRLRSKR
ncbi:MAG TPA: TIGR02611 family protein [Candidatus Saccharimonadales bacterium]|jgi:uncharacterized protein (TIGR02611 family)|nr:TIGR02611 family protein [Candidatus Saccharimonadales bacterium]